MNQTFIGVELGSTRAKAALIDGGRGFGQIAAGAYDWENRLEGGVWTYHLEDVWKALGECSASLARDAAAKGFDPAGAAAGGVSAMMHGYLAFDKDGRLLAPFRTWRNTTTGQAAEALTREFGFNIPQRWSAAHLYQAVLNDEPHIRDIAFITTLAGYVHWRLTGRRVIGVGDASGMFPIGADGDYDAETLRRFDRLVSGRGLPWRVGDILPRTLRAGEDAGAVTPEGARLLGQAGAGAGALREGLPLCPPEGDAGTGMAATNSVAPRTGNVSAGTSVFAMVVLENPLSKVHPEIDIVTTPTGRPTAMVHCNTCTSDLDAWARLFGEAAALTGTALPKSALYEALYRKALEGDADCGGLLAYNYYGGEPVTGIAQGRPLFVRRPESALTLANFARTLLYSALGALKSGMDLLLREERVRLDCLTAHGGLFKTPVVGQRILAGALGVPVAVRESAGEGGAWGIALLAAYMTLKAGGESLESFLGDRVFAGQAGAVLEPDPSDAAGFAAFMERYTRGLKIEAAAGECL